MTSNLASNDKIWSNKNVLVTGVNGFIGGNLVQQLVAHGATVTGLVRNINQHSMLFFDGFDKHIQIVTGDLCDRSFMERVIAEGQFDVCFHLAAQVEVGVALSSPYTTFETNIRGTYTLLEAIRLSGKGISAIVIASTDKAYGSYPPESMPYREDYPLKPQFPYDTSKACADLIAQSYAHDIFGLPIVITRFCNIFGPGQLNFSALIPDAIQCALGYKTFIPRGDGSHIRDFIFSGDVADLYLRIAESISHSPEIYRGKIYNAGTNQPRSVRSVIEELFGKFGNQTDLELIIDRMKGATTTGEIDVQYMDFVTVKRDFGWEPRTSFEDGLNQTVKWFEKYLASEK